MKVREIMTSDVSYCRADASLTQVAAIMWHRDCGVVPVVDENQKVVGIITDRDIAIALATRNRLASEITASDVISGSVKTCLPDDKAEDALKRLRKLQLRRLPVISDEGVLVGILSINDIIRHSGKGGDKISPKKTLSALKEISRFRQIKLSFVKVENDERQTVNVDDAEKSVQIIENEINEINGEFSGVKDNWASLSETALEMIRAAAERTNAAKAETVETEVEN